MSRTDLELMGLNQVANQVAFGLKNHQNQCSKQASIMNWLNWMPTSRAGLEIFLII